MKRRYNHCTYFHLPTVIILLLLASTKVAKSLLHQSTTLPSRHSLLRQCVQSNRRLSKSPARVLSAPKMVKREDDSSSGEADIELFIEWVKHDDLSFHEFNPETAQKIQTSLLGWYYDNRRKLPWRGDPPPFDGSTAGINNPSCNGGATSHPAAKKKKEEAAKNSKKITTFFTSKAPKSKTIDKKPAKDAILPAEIDATPVSAYGVWVSEIMLQQTRVEAVIPYWIKWMQSFPTVYDLATATEDQVNAHWAGLGFYRRARLLHQGAKMVVQEYNGELPRTVDGLLKISGIGPYTASAIASIAFGVNVPVVDGNVCRVLSRLTGIATHIKAPALKDKLGWDLATQLVRNSSHAGDMNQALMEVGATYCAPSGTGIDPRDPLKDFYFSTRIAKGYHALKKQQQLKGTDNTTFDIPETCSCPICDKNGVQVAMDALEEKIHVDMNEDEARKVGQAVFPLNPPKGKRREEDLAVGVLSAEHENELWWLLVRRPPTGLLAGQWEFPSICVESRQEGQTKPSTPGPAERRKALTEHLEVTVDTKGDVLSISHHSRKLVNSKPLEHIFSHVKHNMWIETASVPTEMAAREWNTKSGTKVRWMRESDMKDVGITSGVRKILKTVKAPAKTKASGALAKKRKR